MLAASNLSAASSFETQSHRGHREYRAPSPKHPLAAANVPNAGEQFFEVVATPDPFEPGIVH